MKNVLLNFEVEAQIIPGEELYLLGNTEELGKWDTFKGLKLCRSTDGSSSWVNLKPIEIQTDTIVEFKIIRKTSFGQFLKWESIQGNRCIALKASATVYCTQNSPHLKCEEMPSPLVIPCRNKTFDILNDLSGMMSSSSSGNERQFWLEANMKRNKNIVCRGRIDQFIREARKIFGEIEPSSTKTLSPNGRESPLKKDKSSTRTTSEHIFMRVKEENQKDDQWTQSSSMLIMIPTKTMPYIHFSSNNEQKITLQSHHGYRCLHLETEDWQSLDEVIFNLGHVIVVRTLKILHKLLEQSTLKGYEVSLLKDKNFKIAKSFNRFSLVMFEPELICLEDLDLNEHGFFFNKLEKLVIQQNIKVEQKKNSNQLRKRILAERTVQKIIGRKLILFVRCQTLHEIPQKIINTLLKISSASLTEIYFLTEDNRNTIKKKLPVSEKDKVFVVTDQGEYHSPNSKIVDLYEELGVSKEGARTYNKRNENLGKISDRVDVRFP